MTKLFSILFTQLHFENDNFLKLHKIIIEANIDRHS